MRLGSYEIAAFDRAPNPIPWVGFGFWLGVAVLALAAITFWLLSK